MRGLRLHIRAIAVRIQTDQGRKPIKSGRQFRVALSNLSHLPMVEWCAKARCMTSASLLPFRIPAHQGLRGRRKVVAGGIAQAATTFSNAKESILGMAAAADEKLTFFASQCLRHRQ